MGISLLAPQYGIEEVLSCDLTWRLDTMLTTHVKHCDVILCYVDSFDAGVLELLFKFWLLGEVL